MATHYTNGQRRNAYTNQILYVRKTLIQALTYENVAFYMARRRSRIATLNKYNMGGPFNSWEIRSDRYFNSFTANGGIPTELRNRLRWDCHDLLRSMGQRYGARRELVYRMLRNCNDFLRLRGFSL